MSRYRNNPERHNRISFLINDKELDIYSPDLSDWRNSAKLIEQYKQEKPQVNVNALRKMQLDCLIATMSIRINATILTGDNDFKDLKNLKNGKKLKILKFGEYKYV